MKNDYGARNEQSFTDYEEWLAAQERISVSEERENTLAALADLENDEDWLNEQ